jgi:hypothetical protein
MCSYRRFPLRKGDPVSVRLGLDGVGDYNGLHGKVKGFYKAEVLTVHKNTSLVRFKDRISPDYSEATWNSFLKTNPELSDSDRCHVDEVMNSQLIYTGL